jgi:hypothetical protein
MNRIKLIQNVAAFFAVIMMVFAPMLAASPAEAQYRRAGAACGPRGCVAARGGYHGGAAACGARGCAAVGRHGGAAVVRRPAGIVVVNPHRRWPAGGAIAAGAAIGFVAGAAAVSAYGHPPTPGQCWYYTTPAKTSGFWDVCPR